MKTYEFKSFAAFHMAEVAGEYEALIVVNENGWVKSDLLTECKSWKTAVRRFFKALAVRYPEIAEEWEEGTKESAENGYFKGNDYMMADGSRNEFPRYAWEIEEISEGVFYIFLNVKLDETDTASENFPKLCEAVHAESVEKMDKERGYILTRAESLREYLTPVKWAEYQAGTLTEESAQRFAVRGMVKKYEAWEEKRLGMLRAAAAAPVLSWLSVAVEWKRNSTWGNNPTATVRANDGTFMGWASGCGYDKESAAVGEALNKSFAVRKVLFTAAEKALNAAPLAHVNGGGCVSWRESIGYGSGYDVLPYFEGGVGVNCFWSILEKCGYACRCSASGRSFASYTAEKKEA